jgi:hypothetical protein
MRRIEELELELEKTSSEMCARRMTAKTEQATLIGPRGARGGGEVSPSRAQKSQGEQVMVK